MKKAQSKQSASNGNISDVAKQAQLSRQKKKGFFTGQVGRYTHYIVYGSIGGLILAAILAVIIPSGKKLTDNVIVKEEIDSHNTQNYSFQVGANDFFSNLTLADTQKLFMNQLSHKQSLIRCPSELDQNIIDLSYNFRTKYPHCVRPVGNQGKDCSSAYSMAAVSSVADRMCAETNGDFNFGLSAQQSVSCYENQSYKCDGGFISKTFQRGKTTGFVKEECLPYHGKSSSEGCNLLERCENFKIFDYCISAKQENIKREIMLNGPTVGLISLFSDFLTYKSGIYRVLENSTRLRGQQAVKIIGWDTDPMTKEQYWIIENTWGDSWGQNGLAWIAMGQEELRLEEYTLSAITIQQAESAQVAQQAAQAGGMEGNNLNFNDPLV